jgi:hypothetical protein
MKFLELTFRPSRSSQPPRIHGSLAAKFGRILSLYLMSSAAALAIAYIVLNQIPGASIEPLLFLQAGVLWPILLGGIVVTGAHLLVLSLVRRRRKRRVIDTESGEQPSAQVRGGGTVRSDTGLSHQVLHLTRNAERLDDVERDLIHRISDRFPVDLATQKLLTEMRVCTNRLRGQISDMERLEMMAVDPERETTRP